jgi:hypothetical protein
MRNIKDKLKYVLPRITGLLKYILYGSAKKKIMLLKYIPDPHKKKVMLQYIPGSLRKKILLKCICDSPQKIIPLEYTMNSRSTAVQTITRVLEETQTVAS